MNQEQVEVVDTPVRELLLGDGGDAVAVVEGVPELGDDKEFLALYQAIFYGTGDALTALNLVAVVCGGTMMVSISNLIFIAAVIAPH